MRLVYIWEKDQEKLDVSGGMEIVYDNGIYLG
jgi:hypothetical protein